MIDKLKVALQRIKCLDSLLLYRLIHCVPLKKSLRRKEVKFEKEKQKKVVLVLHLLQLNWNHTYIRGWGTKQEDFSVA